MEMAGQMAGGMSDVATIIEETGKSARERHAGGLLPMATVVATGRWRSFNGIDEVPRGLFGVHAAELTPEQVAAWGVEMDRVIDFAPTGESPEGDVPMLIECLFDRYQPALQLTRPSDWREHLRELGARYAGGGELGAWSAESGEQSVEDQAGEMGLGERKSEVGSPRSGIGTGSDAPANPEQADRPTAARPRIIEFWNEPYLNWAGKPGVNYDGGFYDLAGAAAGQPVRRAGAVVPELVWDKQILVALAVDDRRINFVATRFLPAGLAVGEIFVWHGREYQVESRWWVRDVTQTHWYSGDYNRRLYHEMLAEFVAGFRGRAPADRTDTIGNRQSAIANSKLVVGWGFHLNQDGWHAWEALHRPLIDLAHEWIDGYNEHHYGGDTRMVAATYETAYAYALSVHGKRLKFYNTEAGGMLDPERPDSYNLGLEGEASRWDRGTFTYLVRDILHLIDVCPDKAASRAAHQPQHSVGEPLAFKILKPLRGKLLEVESMDADVWAVGSIGAGQLCLAVFNDDGLVGRRVEIDIQAPVGTSFRGGTGYELAADRLALAERGLSATGQVFHPVADLRPRGLAVYVLRLTGRPTSAGLWRVEQFVAGEILQEIGAAEAELVVNLPANRLARAQSAHLRLVTEDWRADTRVLVNGRCLGLRVERPYVQDHRLPCEWLTSRTVVRVVGGAAAAGRVCAASILLGWEEA